MKLVAYSTKKAPNKSRTGLLWGDWILDVDRITSVAEKLSIPTPRSIRNLPAAATIRQILSKNPKLLKDLQSLSWRIFNRVPPEHVHRFMTRTQDATARSPIPDPPTLRDFYAFEDHVKAAQEKLTICQSEKSAQADVIRDLQSQKEQAVKELSEKRSEVLTLQAALDTLTEKNRAIRKMKQALVKKSPPTTPKLPQ